MRNPVVRMIRSAAIIATYLASVFSGTGCDVKKPIVTTVAEKTSLQPGWQAFDAHPPLEPLRRTQRVSVEVDAIADWNVDNAAGVFTAPDGTRLRLAVQLVGDNNSFVDLAALGLGPGLTFAYVPKSQIDRLPNDITYIQIRIKSNTAWEGGALQWIDLTNY